jgi:hypothetical protein
METRPQKGGGGLNWLWWIAGAIALVILAVILWQLFAEEQSAGPEAAVTVSNITDNPQEYYGSTVTVSGQIGELIGPRAFTIGTEDDVGGGTLLVVGAKQLPEIIEGEAEEVATGDVVQVSGPVQEFNIAEIEDEFGFDLEDGLFSEYEGDPVVVANTVDLTAEAADAGAQNVQATMSDITDEPEEYYGQTLTVAGIVDETIEANAFVLIDQQAAGEADAQEEDDLAADEGVLVVNSEGFTPNVSEGQRVQVKGAFQEFDLAAFEEELGVDLENDAFANFAGRPAIQAQQIQKK